MKRKGSVFVADEPNLSGSRLADYFSEQAFTLTELVVVLATIAILGGLLLPALAATHDRSNRSVCQDHLRQIGVAVTRYASDNNGSVFPVLISGRPNTIYTVSTSTTNIICANPSFGLDASATNQDGRCIWTCPNRPSLPYPEPYGGGMWDIGYEYFGGVANWNNGLGTFPSRSPTNFWQAKPYWTLAADANMRDNVAWGDLSYQTTGQEYIWDNIPPHRTADASFPQGGNQVFCDGSVQWIDFEKMYGLIRWTGGSGQQIYCFFYQDPSDFDSTLLQHLQILRAQP